MNCWNCNKCIQGKSWNHLKDIQELNEDGKIMNVEKHICGYICYRRLSEKEILPKNLWNHIVNKEDYKGLISPIIPKKKEFYHLTHEELKTMDDEEVEKYYQERDNQLYLDPEMKNIHDELLLEDRWTEYLEQESSCDEFIDDY